MDIYRVLIVPAADAPLARTIALTLGGAAGAGFWEIPLGETPDGEVTHYYTEAFVPPAFASMVPCSTYYYEYDEKHPWGQWVERERIPGDPVAVYQGCVAAGLAVTQDDIDGLFVRADVSAQQGYIAVARRNLYFLPYQPAIPEDPTE
jgi:hypothetical protein